MSECNCTMRQKLVGDGCEICNPKMALSYAKETIVDQDKEIASLQSINTELYEALELLYDHARLYMQVAGNVTDVVEQAINKAEGKS